MKSNEQLQKDVQDAIKWEPLLKAAEIGVTSKDGVITLTGTIDSYVKKLQAEEAAKNVAGVTAVVEKIQIKFGALGKTDDNDIAIEVVNAFKWNWEIPSDTIKVKVEDGSVTLEGQVERNYQREAARKVVGSLMGVKAVINNIKLKTDARDNLEKADIERALERNWSIDEHDINVKVSGNNVTLTGKVDSIYQKEEAGRIAWGAPGVWALDNELVIG